jgi:N-formylglutamate amidohydrolase
VHATPWTIERGSSPIIATAIHAGHGVRPDALAWMAIDEPTRLREEDPYTDRLATIADSRIVVHRSRFEVDLNRPRDRALYRMPDQSWGIQVWKPEVPDEIFERSLAQYDQFNDEVFTLLDTLIEQHGLIVVFDIHSYNYRRQGTDQPPADPHENPEINLGTGTMDRDRYARIVDAFIDTVGQHEVAGHPIDVRENVKFRGGDFARRIHERYPGTVCVLSIEFKKIFMDEWSGRLDEEILAQLRHAIDAAGVELRKLLDAEAGLQ